MKGNIITGVFFLGLFTIVGGSLGWTEAARVLRAPMGFGVAALYPPEEKYLHSSPTGSAILPICNASFKN